MARTGITYEHVAAAADALLAESQAVTIKTVRERLGTGSPNTVQRHLLEWRAARPVAVKGAPELPAALVAALGAAIAHASTQAKADVEQLLQQAQDDALALVGACDALEQECAALREQLAALRTQRDREAGMAADRAQEIERLRAMWTQEREARGLCASEAAVLAMQLNAMQTQLNTAISEMAQARAETIQARLNEKQWVDQAAELRGNLTLPA